ncbi:HalOD1 output domain-containing protein [Haladaptatus pallidirubidus]|uniref:HalOD1 output domain-containing protein n=1 Tax=Haladaptatus pallidirubidus TaxID=1008152 RepID=UPI001D0FDAC5
MGDSVDFVDPEALDRLFEPRHDGTLRNTNRQVQFRYEDYTVRVQTGGAIILSHPTESSSN